MASFNILWNRYDAKFSCVVGHLEYNDYWTFYYDLEGLKVAQTLGFTMFPEFSDAEKVYTSDKLFSTFDLRIRRTSNEISESEKINLITQNKGILETDNISISQTPVLVKGR